MTKLILSLSPKSTLERSDLPLDKIYAYEQIRLAEKYIERQSWDENEGYKERIVELAVEYQIDSKYTAFIAVNDRDEKLTDIPELQDTILESPDGWETRRILSMSKFPISLDRSYYRRSDVADYSLVRKTTVDNIIDQLFEKIKECEELIDQNIDYQEFLDEIIDELRLQFSSPSKEYKKLFKKMKQKTPKVYAFIEPHLQKKNKDTATLENGNF
ncbi:MAG: hypothetical protein LBT05_14870 [Planctomycetaceae bacterium]|jgi:hypothetical protein|nr:hypothetical protein [Planctomycetaceae bacterium]